MHGLTSLFSNRASRPWGLVVDDAAIAAVVIAVRTMHAHEAFLLP